MGVAAQSLRQPPAPGARSFGGTARNQASTGCVRALVPGINWYAEPTSIADRDQLRSLDCPVDQWDDWFVSIAASCMDLVTRQAWEAELERLDALESTNTEGLPGQRLPSFTDLNAFLNGRCRMAVAALRRWPSLVNLPANPEENEQHGHAAWICPSRSTCQVCNAMHHTLLHEGGPKRGAAHDGGEPPEKTTRMRLVTQEDNRAINPAAGTVNSLPSRLTVLPTALVRISGPQRQIITVRSLFDNCSEVSLIAHALALKLQAPIQEVNTEISVIGGGVAKDHKTTHHHPPTPTGGQDTHHHRGQLSPPSRHHDASKTTATRGGPH
ncbi:unnamed protein product [Trichogramma brassicae]|uniref:Peptidase aspartic putative domain-containing protein n=1 Tax=Trichogramma brassicae TaxID=86971 RepID=A0A6H5IBN3_9HYME|nr:unnamed protein product [Trichogramma brassicae]